MVNIYLTIGLITQIIIRVAFDIYVAYTLYSFIAIISRNNQELPRLGPNAFVAKDSMKILDNKEAHQGFVLELVPNLTNGSKQKDSNM